MTGLAQHGSTPTGEAGGESEEAARCTAEISRASWLQQFVIQREYVHDFYGDHF
jgi:hypothetical protein